MVAALVILLLAILAAACFLYRRLPEKRETVQAVDNIENAAYDGNAQLGDDSQYEEPAAYAQLDSSKRIPLDQNYESLNVEGYEPLNRDPNENATRYASLNMDTNHNVKPEDSVYEIIP